MLSRRFSGLRRLNVSATSCRKLLRSRTRSKSVLAQEKHRKTIHLGHCLASTIHLWQNLWVSFFWLISQGFKDGGTIKFESFQGTNKWTRKASKLANFNQVERFIPQLGSVWVLFGYLKPKSFISRGVSGTETPVDLEGPKLFADGLSQTDWLMGYFTVGTVV